MDIKTDIIPDGYHLVPAGKIATVVTIVEMRERRAVRQGATDPNLRIEHWPAPENERYLKLYRAVGEEWLWATRLAMSAAELRAILTDPAVEIHALIEDDRTVGLLELDFRKSDECEIVFFGLVKEAIGKGAGRFLMNFAIERAWSKPIERLWLHTCHTDSPQALAFYQRMGFQPVRRLVEIVDDPRTKGILPGDAGRHLPLL